MTNNTIVGSTIILIALLMSAASQVLLKLSAKKEYKNIWEEYFNPLVIIAYGIYFVTTIMSVQALRFIPLTLSTALGTLGQIFVPVMSRLFLREKISKRKGIGMCIIVVGIAVFAL